MINVLLIFMYTEHTLINSVMTYPCIHMAYSHAPIVRSDTRWRGCSLLNSYFILALFNDINNNMMQQVCYLVKKLHLNLDL